MQQRLHQAALFVVLLAVTRAFAVNIERGAPDQPDEITVPISTQLANPPGRGANGLSGLKSSIFRRGYDTNSGGAILGSRQTDICPYYGYGYCEDSNTCCPLLGQCVSSSYSRS